jgi:hypothetical protein
MKHADRHTDTYRIRDERATKGGRDGNDLPVFTAPVQNVLSCSILVLGPAGLN